MSQENVYQGLCQTCKHDSTCSFHRTKELPIIQCEEFETTESQVSRWLAKAPSEVPMDPAEVGRLGLCANCSNVASCSFPDARNRVLMCEEYTLEESPAIPVDLNECIPEAVEV